MTTAAKEFETKDALANGADEIDMVINIGWAKTVNLMPLRKRSVL